jgi:hypothetical protein
MLCKEGVVEHDVEFRCARCYGSASLVQFGVRVLSAFVETDDAGNDDGTAFEIGDAALDPVEADAYGLRSR